MSCRRSRGPALDRYSWVVLAAASAGFGLMGCCVHSMTLMHQALLSRFQLSAGLTGKVGGLFGVLTFAAGPVVAVLSRRLGYRVNGMLSGVSCCVGLLMVAFAVHPAQVFVGFGVITAFGICQYRFSAFVILSHYFKKHRSLATAISVAGTSVGIIIFAPFLQFLFDYYGFTGAILIEAGILLNFTVASAFFRPVIQQSSEDSILETKVNRLHCSNDGVYQQPKIKSETELALSKDYYNQSKINENICTSGDIYHQANTNTDSSVYSLGDKYTQSKINKYMYSTESNYQQTSINGDSKPNCTEENHYQAKIKTVCTLQCTGDKCHQSIINNCICNTQNNCQHSKIESDSKHCCTEDNCQQTKINTQNDLVCTENADYQEPEINTFIDRVCSQCLCTSLGLQSFTEPLVLTTAFLACTRVISFYTALIYLSGLAKEHASMSNADIALILSISGIVDIIGKLIYGKILDIGLLRRHTEITYPLLSLIMGVSMLMTATFAQSFWALTAGYSVYICTSNVTFSQLPGVLLDLVGADAMPAVLGTISLGQGLAIMGGITLAGHLVDSHGGSHVPAFYFAGTLSAAGAVLHLLTVLIVRYHKHRQEERGRYAYTAASTVPQDGVEEAMDGTRQC